jgi:hypothetical protein
LSLKTHEELERLADALSNIKEGADFGRRFLELCGDLKREDILALAEVHRRRAEEAGRT